MQVVENPRGRITGPAVGWTVFDVGDAQGVGLDASHRLLIHKICHLGLRGRQLSKCRVGLDVEVAKEGSKPATGPIARFDNPSHDAIRRSSSMSMTSKMGSLFHEKHIAFRNPEGNVITLPKDIPQAGPIHWARSRLTGSKSDGQYLMKIQ